MNWEWFGYAFSVVYGIVLFAVIVPDFIRQSRERKKLESVDREWAACQQRYLNARQEWINRPTPGELFEEEIERSRRQHSRPSEF
jgi:hypothetical protein